jgi:hypothetical protein
MIHWRIEEIKVFNLRQQTTNDDADVHCSHRLINMIAVSVGKELTAVRQEWSARSLFRIALSIDWVDETSMGKYKDLMVAGLYPAMVRLCGVCSGNQKCCVIATISLTWSYYCHCLLASLAVFDTS